MNSLTQTPLEELCAAVRASAKNRALCQDTIRRLGARELLRQRSLKDAIKTTKNALHQLTGAYQYGRKQFDAWQAQLSAASDEPTLHAACREVLKHHASTQERLPFLPEFYKTLFAELPPVRSIQDVACGFHPLAIPWMPLAPDVTYYACDLHEDLTDYLNAVFPLLGVNGRAETRDVIASPPTQPVQLAFVLKLLPLLEQDEKGAGLRLLRALNADHILVSFPTRSLGGRGKGMAENYETRFRETIAGEAWKTQRFLFPTELCFLITKT